MPVLDLIRDSFVGQLVYYGSGRRYFQYEEEKPGFVVPSRFFASRRNSDSGDASENATLADKPLSATEQQQGEKTKGGDVTVSEGVEADGEAGTDGSVRQSGEDVERGTTVGDSNLVDWYGPDDPEHPFNVRKA